MGQIQRVEAHGQRLQQARQLFFAQGTPPEGLLDPLIIRSWERCLRFGLGGCAEMTQKQVADIMGISQSYISRLEKRILNRLQKDMTQMG